jgi:hypothetical protein
MSEGGKIEIKVGVTGASESAAEFKKVEAAAESLGKKTAATTGFGGMLDNVPERAEVATEAIQELADTTEELPPLADAASSSFDELGTNVDKIKQIQLAQTVSQIAGQIKNLSNELKNAGPEMDVAFGTEAAGKIRGAAEATGYLATVAGAAANGFAVGGPLGGALAGTAAALVETGKEAFHLAGALGAADAAKARSVEMLAQLEQAQRDAATAQEDFTAVVLNDEVTRIYENQSEALKGLIEQLDQARKVTNAGDKVDAARRDNDDDAAIRGGAAEENVKGKRITDDAALKKKRIDEELADAELIARQKQKIAEELERGVTQVKGDGVSTPEQIKAQEDNLRKAQDAAAAAASRAQNRGQLAPLEKEEIDNRTTGSINELGAKKQARLARERDAAARKEAAEARKQQQADLETRQGKLADTATANKARINAGGKATGQRPKTDGGLQDIAKDIGNADTEREIAAVAAKINAAQGQLGAATVAALTQMLAAQLEQAKAITILQKQLKNR